MRVFCPVCDNDCSTLYKNWNDYSVFLCPNCGLSFCKDFLEKEELGNSSRVHSEGIKMMRESFFKTDSIAESFTCERIKVYNKILNRKCKDVIEIGCGPGVFYAPYKRRNIYWEGIEINPLWVDFGRDNNVPIFFKKLDEIKKKFDVVMAHQVLEHVEQPKKFINQINNILKPGGLIHFELPNDNSLTSRLRKLSPKISYDYGFIQPPMHLRAYKASTLKYLFENNGYKINSLFICGNNNKIWGQVRYYKIMQKLFYSFSSMIGMGSLLVGLARKSD